MHIHIDSVILKVGDVMILARDFNRDIGVPFRVRTAGFLVHKPNAGGQPGYLGAEEQL